MRRHLLIVVVGLTVLATPGWRASARQAQAGVLAGKVVDVAGALAGATVTVTRAGGAPRTTVTDSRADYRLDNLAPGNYRVQVELTGFLPSVADAVSVDASRTTWHDVELRLGPNTVTTHGDITSALGNIGGRVVDGAGGVLPGVTVSVSAAQTSHKVFTDPRGEYRIDGLVPGQYRVEATLPGFRPTAMNLAVDAGRTTRSHIALRLGLLSIVDHVMPAAGIVGGLREANVVVHLQITESLGARLRHNQSWLVTEHRAKVLALVKTDQAAITPGSEITFDQDAAGEWVESGYRSVGIETPYRPGLAFVAFLRRNPDSTLAEYRGMHYMWPASKGFVIIENPVGALPPGLRGRMPVEECLAVLRKLIG